MVYSQGYKISNIETIEINSVYLAHTSILRLTVFFSLFLLLSDISLLKWFLFVVG